MLVPNLNAKYEFVSFINFNTFWHQIL